MNPVEIAILSVVTVLFGHSVYQLVHDSAQDRLAMLSTSASPAIENRAPASATDAAGSPLATLGFRCLENQAVDTSAEKFRLGGRICSPSDTDGANDSLPHETRIVNETNHYAATVFQDAATLSFTTDYIPLNTGSNTIKVEFVYKGGKTVAQEMAINKL